MMEDILRDLYIPKKQINGTEIANRFRAIVHKSWIKSLIENKKLLNNSPVYKDEVIQIEWPKKQDLDCNWDFVYIVVRNFYCFPIYWIFFKTIYFFLGLQEAAAEKGDSITKDYP